MTMKPRHQSLQKLYKSFWTLVPKEYYIDGLVSLIYVYKNDLQGFTKENDLQHLQKMIASHQSTVQRT